MPWKVRSVELQRQALCDQIVNARRSASDVFREFGISRKTAYKWLNKGLYRAGPGVCRSGSVASTVDSAAEDDAAVAGAGAGVA